jgi:CheY-like chemotaxis protein
VTESPAGNKGVTLLVVDDEEPNRVMLSRRLGRQGYQVLVASDGYAALGMVESESVDLVLLDIMMPGIDGLEVLESLREKRSEAELPIIMASALGDSEIIVKALSSGANDYITKPLDLDIVLARIESQLRNKPMAPPTKDPEPREVGPGAILGGRYELVSVLGQGNFGTVYRARHLELEFDVAVKLLHANMVQDPALLERFRREGISSCRVQHPNAVSIYDFQVTETAIAYLVMEFLRGISLADYLDEQPPLPPERCAEILVPVCDALAVAHAAGVVHRDIKPENLFLQKTGDGEVPKILDFGISELIDDAGLQKLTQVGMVIGSPLYMAPERFLGEPVNVQSDVFSLGVLLFRMLSSDEPFAGLKSDELRRMHLKGEVPTLEAHVPKRVKELVRSAMNRDPDGRPNVVEFARSLREVAEVSDAKHPGRLRRLLGRS